MRIATKRKIQEALARYAGTYASSENSDGADNNSAHLPAAKYNTQVLVDDVVLNPISWTIKEIASRHHLSYWTVYRALKGRAGWLVFGNTIRVSDSLYRSWVSSAIETGLLSKASSNSAGPSSS